MDYLSPWILFVLLSTACSIAVVFLWRWRRLSALLELYPDQGISLLESHSDSDRLKWNFLPDGLLITDTAGVILQANSQMTELSGYRVKELLGQPVSCLFPQKSPIELKDLSLQGSHARQFLMGLDGIGDGLKARRKDGSLFTAEVSLSRGEGSLSELYALSIRDISDRVGVALEILSSTPNAIFAYDIQSMDIIYANKAAEKHLGYSREQLLTLNAEVLLEQESQASFREHFQRMACGDRQNRSRTYLYRTASGGNMTADVSLHYVDHEENSYLISIGRDVSERIEAMNAIEYKTMELQELNDRLELERENLEQQVQERTRQLETERKNAEQANLAKSSFLASMSHEIRTPMNGVVSMVELLQETELDAEQRAKIDTIQDSAQSLLTIIDEILDFSKVEAGRIELANEAVNIFDLANSVYNSLLALAERKEVVLGFYLDPRLTRVIISDTTRLRQVLVNLVGNAIKFSSGLDRQGRVQLRLEAIADDTLQIVVEDNGIGIARNRLESIFEPFEQEDEYTVARFGGTGLGLPITKALVEKMQGRLDVRSLQNVQTTFTVELPLLPAEQQPEPEPKRLEDNLCVLLARDERRCRNWRDWLVAQGADVICISDWENLLTTLKLQSDGQYKLIGIVVDEEFDADTASRIDQELDKRNLDTFILLQSAEAMAKNKHEHWQLLQDRANENQNFDSVIELLSEATSDGAQCLDRQENTMRESGSSEPGPEAATGTAETEILDDQIMVLVAEDNPINQSVIGSQLEALGFSNTLVSDGVEALEAWKRREHVLLLTDLHMPNMDGYTLAREIRNREQDSERTPIIAYTANAVKGERERCLDCGMDDYLTKPIALKDLEEKISNWASRARVAVAERNEEAGVADASSGKTREEKYLDVEVLKSLVGDKPELIQRLLLTYQDSLQSSYTKIIEAYDANNFEDIESIAHTLKSSSRSVGAIALGELCASLEEAGRSQNVAAAAAAMVGLEELVENVQAELLGQLQPLRAETSAGHALSQHPD